MKKKRQSEDESTLTEITIMPDGRVYVFGMSRPVLKMLGALQVRDERVSRLLEQAEMNRPTPVAEDGKFVSMGDWGEHKP